MKQLSFFLLLFFVQLAVNAQQSAVRPDDSAFIAKYANMDFKGKFAAVIDNDETNNYWLLDFSVLPSRFERVYFMNLSFSHQEIVNVDSDISKSRICFISNLKYKETDVLNLFKKIREQVGSVSSSWPEENKVQWLRNNDKYK